MARVENGQKPVDPVVATEGLTVAELGDDWLSLPQDRKESVIDSYRDHLRAHINPVLGDRLVASITPEDCETLVLGLKRRRGQRPLSMQTKQRIAVSLQALFSFAVKKRKRLDSPAAGLPSVVNDPDDASPDDGVIDPQDHAKYFTADESVHLLRTVAEKFPDWYLFVRIGIRCGLRMGELAALRYEHINWRDCYLNVQAAFVKAGTRPQRTDESAASQW